jgi:hypothetical protein
MLRRVALVRTDVSEELSASFIRVKRIGELGTTLAVTNNRRTLRINTPFFIVTAVKTSTLMEKKSITSLGPKTHDLPAGSILPRPMLPRTPITKTNIGQAYRKM